MMVDQYQHIGSGRFLILSYSTFDPSQKQIWTFLTFDPLTTGRTKRSPWTLFDGWPRPTHWHSQIWCRRLFKIWPSTVTPNDPKMTSDQKFLNTPKEPLAKDLFTQVSSKYIESCRWRSVLSVFEQWPQMTPRWPLTPNSWTPLLSPTWWSLCPSITKIHQEIFEKKHFLIVDGYTDRQIDRHNNIP